MWGMSVLLYRRQVNKFAESAAAAWALGLLKETRDRSNQARLSTPKSRAGVCLLKHYLPVWLQVTIVLDACMTFRVYHDWAIIHAVHASCALSNAIHLTKDFYALRLGPRVNLGCITDEAWQTVSDKSGIAREPFLTSTVWNVRRSFLHSWELPRQLMEYDRCCS